MACFYTVTKQPIIAFSIIGSMFTSILRIASIDRTRNTIIAIERYSRFAFSSVTRLCAITYIIVIAITIKRTSCSFTYISHFITCFINSTWITTCFTTVCYMTRFDAITKQSIITFAIVSCMFTSILRITRIYSTCYSIVTIQDNSWFALSRITCLRTITHVTIITVSVSYTSWCFAYICRLVTRLFWLTRIRTAFTYTSITDFTSITKYSIVTISICYTSSTCRIAIAVTIFTVCKIITIIIDLSVVTSFETIWSVLIATRNSHYCARNRTVSSETWMTIRYRSWYFISTSSDPL